MPPMMPSAIHVLLAVYTLSRHSVRSVVAAYRVILHEAERSRRIHSFYQAGALQRAGQRLEPVKIYAAANAPVPKQASSQVLMPGTDLDRPRMATCWLGGCGPALPGCCRMFTCW